jgi:parallel beta-helix repeat protein
VKTINRIQNNTQSGVLRRIFVCAALVLFLAGCQKQQVVEVSKLTISKDTTWSGNILVAGDVYVEPGATLTITPGTIVKFKRIDETSDQNLFDIDSPYYPQAELIIRGRLIAKGTEKNMITFTSAEIDARPADWGAVNFLGSDANVIQYCRFMFAYNGVHAHGASVTISNSEFVKNGVGISFKSEEETPGVAWFGKRSNVQVSSNIISRNKGGIGFRNSDALIRHNEISDNKFFGIFPKEDVRADINENDIHGNKKGVYLYQARGLVLSRNNIFDNVDYNISVAEAQDYNIDARNNWFGTINREKIEALIFDKEDDSELGRVAIDPFLDTRVKWEQAR